MKRVYSANKINLIKKREAETWIYSYADLITNLLALFVMLLILSNGSGKAKYDFIRGIESYVSGKKYATGRIGSGQGELDQLSQIISEVIQKSQLSGQVNLSKASTGLALTFESALVFDSGTAKLNDEATVILEEVAELAKALPPKFFIVVEGHADSRPVSGGIYPSNWELSSARAGAIVRFLQSQGFPSIRMRAIGYADTQPLENVADSAKNRRVVIKIDSEENWKNP